MRLIGILFLAGCVCSCKQRTSKMIIAKTADYVVVDTCAEAEQFLSFDDDFSDYSIFYIGPKSDTVKIGKMYWRGRTPWTGNFESPWSRRYSSKTLSIYVDTSFKTNSPVEYVSKDHEIVNDSTINYHSFLFTIRNISDSIIYLGRTFSVYFIYREAKNKNGEWVKVDKKLSELSICGTGEPTISLKPNEIVVSKVKRYKGNFITDFRLVFGYGNNIVYSNIFKDFIDLRTLDK
jgi:hypothetical protein